MTALVSVHRGFVGAEMVRGQYTFGPDQHAKASEPSTSNYNTLFTSTDPAGNVVAIVLPVGNTAVIFAYAYDEVGRLNWGQSWEPEAFIYDADGRRVLSTHYLEGYTLYVFDSLVLHNATFARAPPRPSPTRNPLHYVARGGLTARALSTHQRSLKRLVDAYEIGAIEIDDLTTRSVHIRARIERAQRELADAERRLRETVQLRAIVTQMGDFAARVSAGLQKLSWLQRRTIVRTVVAKIEIDETAATIVYRLPSTQRTPKPPSDAEPSDKDGSNADRDVSCLLRSRRARHVTTGRRNCSLRCCRIERRETLRCVSYILAVRALGLSRPREPSSSRVLNDSLIRREL